MKPTDNAFPQPGVIHWDKEKQMFHGYNPTPGMDIRLWIATHALQGLLSFRDYYGETREPALAALAHADALLKAYNDECKE